MVSTPTRPTAAAIIIGNEILSGKYRDENSPALIEEFRTLGIRLCRIETIRDDLDEISTCIQKVATIHDIVVTSGGIGPTHDDLTMDGIAAAFGVDIVFEPTMVEALKAHYGSELTHGQLRLARVPRGTKLHWLEPGRWPAIQSANVFIFPGVPSLFARNLRVFRSLYPCLLPFVLQSITLLAQESEIVVTLNAIVARHPGVEIGSYPRFENGHPEVRLTLESSDSNHVTAAMDDLLANISAERVVRVDR